MDRCYVVEWNSIGGDPEVVEVFKSFDAALKHCVEAIEEAKAEEIMYYGVEHPGTKYHVVAEASKEDRAVHWVELHQVTKNIDRILEWYRIKEMRFQDECS